MKRVILVTGGAGFIGSNFIHFMFNKYKDNIHIINLDKLTYAGSLENLARINGRENYSFFKMDICDKDSVEKIFKYNNVDVVVNFAAESHVDRSIKDSYQFVYTNVVGTQILLDIAKKYWVKNDEFPQSKKFIQVSTDEVYGSLDNNGFFTEESPLKPRNPYSASKASADLLVQSFFYTYGLPINITRCTNNYGPYQFPEKLVPLTVKCCLNGNFIPIYGDGTNIRDWIFVEDHCKAIDAVICKGVPGEVYNVSSGIELKNNDIVRTIIENIIEYLPRDDNRKHKINYSLIKYVADRKGHDKRYSISSKKIKDELGWQAEVPFECHRRGIIDP